MTSVFFLSRELFLIYGFRRRRRGHTANNCTPFSRRVREGLVLQSVLRPGPGFRDTSGTRNVTRGARLGMSRPSRPRVR